MTEEAQTPAQAPAKASGRLGLLRPRDTGAAKAQSEAYSRAVGVLRWLFPVLVTAGLALLFLWPAMQTNKISVSMEGGAPNLMVEKLHMTGIDARGQAYSITADRALQSAGQKNIVELERPKGDMALQSGAWLLGQAKAGRIDQESKKLWLTGQVELFHDQGSSFASEEMNVDFKQGVAWGDKPVLLKGTFGEIQGAGFEFKDSGKTLIIKGHATAKLSLQKRVASDKPSVNHSSSR